MESTNVERRSSRTTRSVSPIMESTDDASSPGSSGHVTRSHSVEMFETITTTTTTNDNKKRKLKPPKNSSPSKKAKETVLEREARSPRKFKGVKESRKTQRDKVKQRLEELDEVEKSVRDGSHAEYHRLLQNAEDRRTQMLNIIEAKRALAENSVIKFFKSQKNVAYSQYYWDKLALRRSMVQKLQQQISTLDQEYHSSHTQSSLDDEFLADWSPPNRPTMISSLTLGLSEDVAEHDIEQAKQDPSTTTTNTTTEHLMHSRESSPPIDMLASLADHQYQRDFEQNETSSAINNSASFRAPRHQMHPQQQLHPYYIQHPY